MNAPTTLPQQLYLLAYDTSRQRIRQLTDLCGPAVPALRSVIRGMRAASSGS